MIRRTILALALLALTPSALGAETTADRGPARTLAGGVSRHAVRTQAAGGLPATRLWLYLPAGKPAPRSLPVVLIAAAGSSGITGSALADEDQAEHLPYAAAGFAVVAYELDGAKAPDASDAQVVEAVQRFMRVKAGVENGRAALAYLEAHVPEVDVRRAYAAGHSSAATAALLLTAADARIRACAAYMPIGDLKIRLGAETLAAYDEAIPGFAAFATSASPASHVAELRRPLLLATAADDENVPAAQVEALAAALRKAGAAVKLVKAAQGGHYDAMLAESLPAGVAWLKAQDAAPTRSP